MKYADLHVHTYFSDGTFSPEEVINRALSGGLSAIAITDHDTVEAIDEAMALAGDRIEIIPGIELTAEKKGAEIHILGYFINWADEAFHLELEALRKIRLERIRQIIDKLNELGIKISFEEALEFSGQGSIGRLHIARMMCQAKYVSSVKEAFLRFIGEGQPAYVGKIKLTPEQAIQMIKRIGGKAVLAHPYLLNHDEWIPDLIRDGLDGMEVYYSTQNPQVTLHYERLATKYNLLSTGGSDCHGLAKSRTLLGKFKLPYDLVEKLRSGKIVESST